MISNEKIFPAGTVYGLPLTLESRDITDEYGKRTACEFRVDARDRGGMAFLLPVCPPIKVTSYDPASHNLLDSSVEIDQEDVEKMCNEQRENIIALGKRAYDSTKKP